MPGATRMSGSDLRITLTRFASPQVGPFILRAYMDLFDRGFFDGRFTLKPDHHVLFIERQVVRDDFMPAAAAAFMVAAETRVLWIDLLYVREEFRGQGLCRRMVSDLAALGRQNDCLELQYGTHSTNTAMRSVAKRLGHREFGILIKGSVDI